MAFIHWLGLICGVFVASSPVGTTSPSLALLTSNQTSHLRPNGSPLVIVSAPSKPPFLHLGGLRPAMTSNRSRLGDDTWRCSSQSFGRPLAPGCQEAYEVIPETPDLLTFKDRTAGSGLGIALPLRSISSDGKSVVEISHKEGAISDRVSGQDLRDIASILVKICVIGKNEGGAAFSIGEQGLLALSVQEYTPNVKCSDPWNEAADIGNCQDILDEMTTAQVPISFGPRGTEGINVGLPLGLRNADRKCVIELQITGDLLIASWYKLWAAAVAVVGMCVRKGQDGVATVEGGIASLTISVSRQRGDDLSGTVTTA